MVKCKSTIPWLATFLVCQVLAGCDTGTAQNNESTDSASTQQLQQGHAVTVEQAYETRLGTMYLCWVTALRTDKHTDADAMAKLLNSFDKKYPDIAKNKDYFVIRAAKDMEKLQSQGDINQFYDHACSKQVSRLQEAQNEGMLE